MESSERTTCWLLLRNLNELLHFILECTPQPLTQTLFGSSRVTNTWRTRVTNRSAWRDEPKNSLACDFFLASCFHQPSALSKRKQLLRLLPNPRKQTWPFCSLPIPTPCYSLSCIPEFYCHVIRPRNQFELGAWWPGHWGNPALVWRQSILHHCSVWKTNTEGICECLSSRDQSGGNLRKWIELKSILYTKEVQANYKVSESKSSAWSQAQLSRNKKRGHWKRVLWCCNLLFLTDRLFLDPRVWHACLRFQTQEVLTKERRKYCKIP